jgi:hypothetical protein
VSLSLLVLLQACASTQEPRAIRPAGDPASPATPIENEPQEHDPREEEPDTLSETVEACVIDIRPPKSGSLNQTFHDVVVLRCEEQDDEFVVELNVSHYHNKGKTEAPSEVEKRLADWDGKNGKNFKRTGRVYFRVNGGKDGLEAKFPGESKFSRYPSSGEHDRNQPATQPTVGNFNGHRLRFSFGFRGFQSSFTLVGPMDT